MNITLTINGVNTTPSPALLEAIKKEYPEWPGSIMEARERLKPDTYLIMHNDVAKTGNSGFKDYCNVCTLKQANAHAAFGDLLVLMTAINGDYMGWPRWKVLLTCNGEFDTLQMDSTNISPIWFKSREAAEHAIKIAEKEFRLFYGVNEKV